MTDEVEVGIRWSDRGSVSPFSTREGAEYVLRSYAEDTRHDTDPQKATGVLVSRVVTRSPWSEAEDTLCGKQRNAPGWEDLHR